MSDASSDFLSVLADLEALSPRDREVQLAGLAAEGVTREQIEELREFLDHVGYAFAERNAGDQVGKFKIIRRIGKGGMGEVWQVSNPDIPEQNLVMKVLHSPGHCPRPPCPGSRFVNDLSRRCQTSHQRLEMLRICCCRR